MPSTHTDPFLGEVLDLLAEHGLAGWPDHRLLERFVRCRDEAAFAALLNRHGPSVLRVCRAILRDAHDADDAFQATFLVLVCSAAKIRKGESVGSYLHGTAYRVAVKARALRRQAQAKVRPMQTEAAETRREPHDVEFLVHEELARLPERLRRAVVLCHFEGKTHAQAAALLGCPVGSVSRHLKRACELLRERLSARGVTASAGLLATALTAPDAIPAALAVGTWKLVAQYTAGSALVGGLAVPAVALARQVLRAATTFKLKGLTALLLLFGLAATGTALFGPGDSAPGDKIPASAPEAVQPAPKVGPAVAAGDRHGDALPDGALARLGTLRLRHGGRVQALAFSPDGVALASLGDTTASLRLWQVPTGKEFGRLETPPAAANASFSCWTAVAFAADGKTMATADDAGTITFHDFSPAKPPGQPSPVLGKARLHFKPQGVLVTFLAFLPDGILLGGTNDGRVYLWDLDGVEAQRFGSAGAKKKHFYAVSADGKTLAMANANSDVMLWNVPKGVQLGNLPGSSGVSSLALTADGKTVAVGGQKNTTRLWDAATRKATATLIGKEAQGKMPDPSQLVHGLAFTPNGKTLLSVDTNGKGLIRVWDVAAGRESRQFEGLSGDGQVLALSPDGKTLAVSYQNAAIRLWDVATGKELNPELGSQGMVYVVAVSPDSKQVAVAGEDGVVRLFDRATGRELGAFRAQMRQMFSMAFTPDGKQLLTAGAYQPAKLWDLDPPREIRAFAGSKAGVLGANRLALSPDGKKAALASNDAAVQLVEVATARVEQTVARGLLDQLAFSPDGKLLVGGGFDKRVHVWDLVKGEELWSVADDLAVAAVAFSPDGRLVVAGKYTGKILVLEAATGKEVLDLQSAGGTVRTLAVSPDGRLLATAGDAPFVELRELRTGQLVQRLTGHTDRIWSVAFAPDGRSLVSGSFDTTALVWDLTGQAHGKKRDALTAAELETCWRALHGASAEGAYKAILALTAVPQQAVNLFKANLAGSEPVDAKALARLLADLDDDSFAVREKASRELAQLGKRVADELRKAREVTQSEEVRRRLDELLARLNDGTAAAPLDAGLLAQRIVAVLELAATPEARDLLLHLSKTATADLRGQAKAALERLTK
jgi:RNA polymerase sigma factor (sigma-70 family)